MAKHIKESLDNSTCDGADDYQNDLGFKDDFSPFKQALLQGCKYKSQPETNPTLLTLIRQMTEEISAELVFVRIPEDLQEVKKTVTFASVSLKFHYPKEPFYSRHELKSQNKSSTNNCDLTADERKRLNEARERRLLYFQEKEALRQIKESEKCRISAKDAQNVTKRSKKNMPKGRRRK